VVAGRGARLADAAFERFGQSIIDLRTMIAFVGRRAFRRVVLAGHSTSANTVLHYVARARRDVGLFKPGQAEAVFPYYRPNARWTALRGPRPRLSGAGPDQRGATKVLSTRPRAAAGSTPLASVQGVASARICSGSPMRMYFL